MTDIDSEKRLAAEASVDLVESGMIVGLGTGSTAAHAIRKLGQRVRGGLVIRAVPTSRQSASLAVEQGNEGAEKNRKLLAAKMSAAQIADAEQRAREWLDQHRR